MEKLIDALLQFWDLFLFATTIDQYERAIVLRFGKFHRELAPGLHLILPFAIERVIKDNVVPMVYTLTEQSLVTKDGYPVVVAASVEWEINDIKAFVLDIEGADSALSGKSKMTLAQLVRGSTYAQLTSTRFDSRFRSRLRKAVGVYGIKINNAVLIDVIKAKGLRIFGVANG